MDGDHDIDRCYEVTQRVLNKSFQELRVQRVALEGMILKPNMASRAKNARSRPSVEEVAEQTVRVLKRCVPAAVPGIAFLSGGQSDEEATAHLGHERHRRPALGPTFSYGRALQAAPQAAWWGKAENVAAGTGRLRTSRPDEFAGEQGRMESRSGKERRHRFWPSKPVPRRPVPRLYLATPDTGDPSPLIASLPALLAAADVAAVLLRLTQADDRTLINRIKALAPVVQDRGAALLLDGHADLVARGGADGAHLDGVEAMAEALPSLKPDRSPASAALRRGTIRWRPAKPAPITCCSANRTDAASGLRPRRSPNAWNGGPKFEPPCVGFAASPEEAHEFAACRRGFRSGRRFHLERCARRRSGAGGRRNRRSGRRTRQPSAKIKAEQE